MTDVDVRAGSSATVVDECVLQPGQDYFSGQIIGPFIDTGRDIDFSAPEGRIYISRDTILDWAGAFGAFHPDLAERLTTGAEEIAAELAEAQQRIVVLERAIEAMVAAGFQSYTPETYACACGQTYEKKASLSQHKRACPQAIEG